MLTRVACLLGVHGQTREVTLRSESWICGIPGWRYEDAWQCTRCEKVLYRPVNRGQSR